MTFAVLAQQPAPDSGKGGDATFLWVGVMLAMGVYLFIVFSGSRRGRAEEKKRREQLAAIKKNDRVVTIGGIIGSVVSVNENEVTLKVDESANVKITFIRTAINRVLRDDERAG